MRKIVHFLKDIYTRFVFHIDNGEKIQPLKINGEIHVNGERIYLGVNQCHVGKKTMESVKNIINQDFLYNNFSPQDLIFIGFTSFMDVFLSLPEQSRNRENMMLVIHGHLQKIKDS